MTDPHSTETEAVATPFTWRDVARHTWWTWAAFMLIVLVVSVIASLPGENTYLSPASKIFIGVTLFFGAGLLGLAALWVCAPLAWLLGKALERVPSRLIHVLAFGAAGALVFTIATLFDRGDPPLIGQLSLENPTAALLLAVSALTGAFGRWMAFRGRARTDAADVEVSGPPPA